MTIRVALKELSVRRWPCVYTHINSPKFLLLKAKIGTINMWKTQVSFSYNRIWLL